MQRRKIILVTALCGAIIGAQIKHLGSLVAGIPALAPDRALLNHRGFLITGMLLLVLFSAYWEIAAKNASAAKSSESRASRAVHVFLVNAGMLLEIAPIHALGRFLPVSPSIMAAALALECLGLLLAVWARRHLGRNWSGEVTIKVEHQLIRSGPYRLLRHPIYTGLLAIYVGVALVSGEWLALIGFALVAFAYWRKIRIEEATLGVAFGPDYAAYRHTSWALVPGLY
jgi:protein-S-isoprenylcysteine O-methyltransferase Ste14